MHLLRSWVESANAPDCDFPLNNLPLGVFSRPGHPPACCTAIGDQILDLGGMERAGLLRPSGLTRPTLNSFMERGPEAWAALRTLLFGYLGEGSQARPVVESHLYPMEAVAMHLPFRVAGLTDFHANRHHALNAMRIFRGPEAGLRPNWLHMPLGYNGRASSVVVSGTDITRPNGQSRPPGATAPVFGPSRLLDYELELGVVVGTATRPGQPPTVAEADAAIFGFVLLNDWSARDIQSWETVPMGPFQSKAFATTIGPWVVTRAALEPFRRHAPPRDIPLLPYLAEPGPMLYDITLEAALQTGPEAEPVPICRTGFADTYFSPAQLVAQLASSGGPVEPGDLIGTGTISGPEPGSYGSLLELTWNGTRPFTLPDGSRRAYLEDGDTVILSGHAAGNGYRVGFGQCRGTIRPAPALP